MVTLAATQLHPACTQVAPPALDTDHDGVSDALEQALLERFAPVFLLSRTDCANQPARFTPGLSVPTVAAQDGTVYGQVFVRGTPGELEVHFYHLWATDCGRLGHPLDTEHVSVLLRGKGTDPTGWTAAYWYAAAHEDTVCDASQVARASTLHAETHGPRVWLSNGKHASFLAETICGHGCGGDRCTAMEPLHSPAIVNLGEVGLPMNGSVFVASQRWPLAQKMGRTDFKPAMLRRLDALPATDIAWAEPSKRPGQAAILGANRGIDGTLTGGAAGVHGAAAGTRATDTALVVAGSGTGHALQRSYGNVRHALGTAAQDTGHALHATPAKPADQHTAPPQ